MCILAQALVKCAMACERKDRIFFKKKLVFSLYSGLISSEAPMQVVSLFRVNMSIFSKFPSRYILI